MIKNKIALRLSLYFFVALVSFTLIITGIFYFSFRTYILESNKDQMEEQVIRTAMTFSKWMDQTPAPRMQQGNRQNRMPMQNNPSHHMYGGFPNHRAYLTSLDNLSIGHIWIVDTNRQILTPNKEDHVLSYSDLPSGADSVVQEVLKGKKVFSQEFSSLITAPTLTAGAPIRNHQGKIIGAVLLHRPLEGINKVFDHSLLFLGSSILVAFALSLLLSLRFSFLFTKPLNTMKDTALELAQGNYQQKNNIHLSDEIGQLANAIDFLSIKLLEASKQKEQLDQFRNDFLVNISHELRTPITIIRGSLEALVDKVVSKPEQIDEYHRQMLQESIFLQRLTNDLLEISKLQNDDFTMIKEDLNLWDPLHDAIRSAQSLGKEKNISFHLELDSKPRLFQGDYGRLRQLFLIILDNAVKFSEEGSRIDIVQNGDILKIRDYGKGIKEKDLPYVFDRFYQTSKNESDTGTGLGLAIAKQIAKRHHISLEAQSIPLEKGALFILEFPQEEKR